MFRARSWPFLICVLTAAIGGALQATEADQVQRATSVAYVANDRAGTISAFRIDGDTGALTPLGAQGMATDKIPYSLTVDPDGRWLYAAHGDASSIAMRAMRWH